MRLTYKYRCYPKAKQELALHGMLAAFCDLYNAGLQERIDCYQKTGRSLGYYHQTNELKEVRVVDERLAGYSFAAEQQVLSRLDKAFQAFFRRCRQGVNPGFPRYRGKSWFDSAEFRVGDGLVIKQEQLRVVGIEGLIRVRWHRALPLEAKLARAVLKRKAGHWYICFSVELPEVVPIEREFSPVGIDLGLTSLVALSNGETVATPQHTQKAASALRRAQRALSRASRGSKRRSKAKLRVQRVNARIARQRRDSTHKLSRSLAARFSHIAFEDLNIRGLAAGMLAKPLHNAAWTQLVNLTTYKAENAGGVVSLVDPRGTSQTCPGCGVIKRKTLTEREHRCGCGCILDRDVAAAQIVLLRANFKGPGMGLGALSKADVRPRLAPEAACFS